jgi:hypothetical protein
LESIIRRESRSLVQYATESFPWITEQEQLALAELRKIAGEESQAVAILGQFLLTRGRSLPYLGLYPMSFTSINYVSLEHLLPLLAEHGRQALAQMERDAPQIADVQARDMVSRYIELKRQHVKNLENLATVNPEIASTRR